MYKAGELSVFSAACVSRRYFTGDQGGGLGEAISDPPCRSANRWISYDRQKPTTARLYTTLHLFVVLNSLVNNSSNFIRCNHAEDDASRPLKSGRNNHIHKRTTNSLKRYNFPSRPSPPPNLTAATRIVDERADGVTQHKPLLLN